MTDKKPTVYAMAICTEKHGKKEWTFELRPLRRPKYYTPYPVCIITKQEYDDQNVEHHLQNPCHVVYLEQHNVWDEGLGCMDYGEIIGS